MKFNQQYENHKLKCIENARRIEAAINQVTKLKTHAHNAVMSNNSSNLKAKDNFELENMIQNPDFLDRSKHANAHVVRYDDRGNVEYYYISFSSKEYITNPDNPNEKHRSLIINKSQWLRGRDLKYIFITDPYHMYYVEDFKHETRTRFQNKHEIVYAKVDEAIELKNYAFNTYLDFKYLSKVDASKVERCTGYFKLTVVTTSGREIVYEAPSMRKLYKQIFEEELIKGIDKISYCTFASRFKKGEDWIVENEDSFVTFKFYRIFTEQKPNSNRKVRNMTIGEIEEMLDKKYQESDESEMEALSLSCNSFDIELVKERYPNSTFEEFVKHLKEELKFQRNR